MRGGSSEGSPGGHGQIRYCREAGGRSYPNHAAVEADGWEASVGSFQARTSSRAKAASRVCARRLQEWSQAQEERRRPRWPSRSAGERHFDVDNFWDKQHHERTCRSAQMSFVDRPSVDSTVRTGLTARYDFDLSFASDQAPSGSS